MQGIYSIFLLLTLLQQQNTSPRKERIGGLFDDEALLYTWITSRQSGKADTTVFRQEQLRLTYSGPGWLVASALPHGVRRVFSKSCPYRFRSKLRWDIIAWVSHILCVNYTNVLYSLYCEIK